MRDNFFTIDDDIYPEILKNIYNPPKKIYYKGNLKLLKEKKKIAIVGTRNNSSYGALCCEKIVKDLIAEDIVIISGFARGIDSIAHRICIENNGKTIAVVASGLDIVYPSSNVNLWKKIEENGLILSEYEYGTKPFRANFPQRNRIIAGLSEGVIVIESKEKGGSLVTANIALDEGRDVYAVPGEIFSDLSRGCNNLIRDSKAKLLNSVEEILKDYNWIMNKNILKEDKNFTEIQSKILNCLVYEKTLDRIVQELNMSTSELLYEIMELEIKGHIKSLAGGKYIKIN
ncbi:DNA-processing protein DprA [Fusobacterium sp.]|uniref:DNA-processing protein DprA n=1 Tax=Fusobacterium TaxID=848 RepID=UPI0025BE57AF|nr:DNA-processing protein DprA [Fusobacterium sp.]MCI5725759.1 DNA-processing protein DprA [Fusobacterium sp.]MCI7222871.1 DNA-processing protein DprA [Fusobacterium sp.]MDY5794630.1 DNA-processing protein DprA [Fusobacterium gastrosuis]